MEAWVSTEPCRAPSGVKTLFLENWFTVWLTVVSTEKSQCLYFPSHVILSPIATGSALLLHLFCANCMLAADRLWSRQEPHSISIQWLLTSERGMKRCCLTLSQSIWNTALHVAGCLTLRGWISLIVAKIKGRRFATICSNFRASIPVPYPHSLTLQNSLHFNSFHFNSVADLASFQ